MYRIKDNTVIGGDKVVTPFGELLFERIFVTDNADIADYFKSHIGYTVTEIEAEEQ